jgi:hypothetical protein
MDTLTPARLLSFIDRWRERGRDGIAATSTGWENFHVRAPAVPVPAALKLKRPGLAATGDG